MAKIIINGEPSEEACKNFMRLLIEIVKEHRKLFEKTDIERNVIKNQRKKTNQTKKARGSFYPLPL